MNIDKIKGPDKVFLKQMLAISVPIALQQFVNSALNMLDVFMIGRLGEIEITGVGLANQIFFLYSLLLFGINSGAAIFISQSWGRNDRDGIYKTMGISFTISLIASAVFIFAGSIFPKELISIYSKDADVILAGAKYLKVVIISYVFSGVSNTIGFALRSIGHPRIHAYVSLASLASNAVLNAILIFGFLGFPALGVIGAAIATDISRVFEFLLIVFLVKKYNMPIVTKIRNYFTYKSIHVKKFFNTAGVVILNEVLWSIGTSMYNVGYKFAGTKAQAAVQISSNIQNMFYVVSFGIGSAAAVMLGSLLGAGKFEKAIDYSKKFFKSVIIAGFVCMLVLLLIRPPLLSVFKISEEVYVNSSRILFVMALYFPARMLNHLIIVGILRCGGDTLSSLFLDGVAVWAIGVPMAFLGTLVFKLPIYLVMALVFAEEPIKLILGLIRVKSKKWVKKIEIS
ncbi:MAG: MATE family efflux transporter [Lachnospiraceae bacterium]|nr:MATE family efflux transporter [Lachnospiraceae bacterium]